MPTLQHSVLLFAAISFPMQLLFAVTMPHGFQLGITFYNIEYSFGQKYKYRDLCSVVIGTTGPFWKLCPALLRDSIKMLTPSLHSVHFCLFWPGWYWFKYTAIDIRICNMDCVQSGGMVRYRSIWLRWTSQSPDCNFHLVEGNQAWSETSRSFSWLTCEVRWAVAINQRSRLSSARHSGYGWGPGTLVPLVGASLPMMLQPWRCAAIGDHPCPVSHATNRAFTVIWNWNTWIDRVSAALISPAK